MIKEYGMFNLHEDHDSLELLFSDVPVTSVKETGEVSVYYHEDQIIGYKITDFIRYAKIKYSGIIFLPNAVLIDVVNNVLKNHHLDCLYVKDHSGYEVRTIASQRIVYALPGTFLKDKTVSKGHICTYDDLFIENENKYDILIVDEEIKEGTDFFQMEG